MVLLARCQQRVWLALGPAGMPGPFGKNSAYLAALAISAWRSARNVSPGRFLSLVAFT